MINPVVMPIMPSGKDAANIDDAVIIDDLLEEMNNGQVILKVVGVKKISVDSLVSRVFNQRILPPGIKSDLEISVIAYEGGAIGNDNSVDFMVSNPVKTIITTYEPVSLEFISGEGMMSGALIPRGKIKGLRRKSYFPGIAKRSFEATSIPEETYKQAIDELISKEESILRATIDMVGFREYLTLRQENIWAMNNFYNFLMKQFNEERLRAYKTIEKSPVISNDDALAEFRDRFHDFQQKMNAYLFGNGDDVRLLDEFSNKALFTQMASTVMLGMMANNDSYVADSFKLFASIGTVDLFVRGINFLARRIPAGIIGTAEDLRINYKKQSAPSGNE